MKLRDYQIEISNRALKVLQEKRIVYLSMEVRTGKTLTALEIAHLFGAKSVLFMTKKKAIETIQEDFNKFGYTYSLKVINDESQHKETGNYDLIIHDEHHRFGSFPKPSKGTSMFKKKYGRLPMIFLSGTPTPESHSQWYHQFWVSNYSPFTEANFYKWASRYVSIKLKYLGYATVNDYSGGIKELIMPVINDYIIRFTQKEAGFQSMVAENILKVKMKPLTYRLIDTLKSDFIVRGKEKEIVADTGAKLMSKLHQLYSGTIKFDDGTRQVIDDSKGVFIQDYFKGKKIAIFYKFVAELECIKQVMGEKVTENLQEFQTSDKWIALQIVSGREGISLKEADCLVYFNIDFSAVSYWQSRDRLTTMERLENSVYWIFSEDGIEPRIYKTVQKKKNFTKHLFIKEYGITFPN
jgi:hypothetical protein